MKILVINGPNLNMLGIREPDHYGKETYADLIKKIEQHCAQKGVEVELFQSNHEGDLVDKIQSAYQNADGIVINPGAYTHTSIAILDAVKAELELGTKAEAIINEYLIPAINEVGQYFNDGKYFLPQLIRSANTMKTAIDHVEPLLEKKDSSCDSCN